MAMQLGSGSAHARPEMNVTPLIDVVLVLLIIFMAMTPLMNRTFWVHTPRQAREEVERAQVDPDPPLVLHLAGDGAITVNGEAIIPTELPERLRRMFAAHGDHVLFFDADDAVPLGTAVVTMDRAREGGAVTIAALGTPPAPAGP